MPKPFDLEKALAGAKLVTREGYIVNGFSKRKKKSGEYPFEAEIIEPRILSYTENGNYYDDNEKSDFDLFLADDEPATNTGILPFDLEKALAGHPVVTRDGQDVTGLHVFDAAINEDALYGVVHGTIYSWDSDNGRQSTGVDDLDLFLKAPAPIKKKGWIGILKRTNRDAEYYAPTTHVFLKEEDAKRRAPNGVIIPIEWEEPEV